MGKINSKAKGKRGELEVAHLLTDLGLPAHRSQQYMGGGDSADVRFTEEGLNAVTHIEVKLDEHLNLDKAYLQAVNDSKPGQTPIVVHRKSRTDWKVTVDAIHYWEMFKIWWEWSKR